MPRFIVLLVLLTSSVYASGICQCPPSIIGKINGIDINPATFIVTSVGAAGYTIDANLTDPTFQFSLHVATNPDPAIGFDMSISGDPTVQLTILQFYLGAFPSLAATGFGGISDGFLGQHGDGTAFLREAFIRTTVTGPGIVGSLVNQIDMNCEASGPLYFKNAPCPSLQPASFQVASQGLGSSDLPLGLLQMDINFHLSDFDAITLRGSSVLVAAPEPATSALFAA